MQHRIVLPRGDTALISFEIKGRTPEANDRVVMAIRRAGGGLVLEMVSRVEAGKPVQFLLTHDDTERMLLEHETRIRALEAKVGVDAPETDEDGAEIVPEFVVGKTYYNGDKVTFNGSVYKCIAPKGDVCVWSPVEYPVYWELVG